MPRRGAYTRVSGVRQRRHGVMTRRGITRPDGTIGERDLGQSPGDPFDGSLILRLSALDA